MRQTNGKFNIPYDLLQKKTIKQLVNVKDIDWTHAPTGSEEWTKTWKDLLPEEYKALPDAFQFYSLNEDIYTASVGMLVVAISRDSFSKPIVTPVPTFQRQLILEACNSFKNFSRIVNRKKNKKNEEGYPPDIDELRVGVREEIVDIFLDVEKCAEIVSIPGVLGESLKPSVHKSVMARSRGDFNQNELLTGNIIIRGYSPSYDIGFAIDSRAGMHLNTKIWYILKPVCILDISNKKFQSDLLEAHEQYISRVIEDTFEGASQEQPSRQGGQRFSKEEWEEFTPSSKNIIVEEEEEGEGGRGESLYSLKAPRKKRYGNSPVSREEREMNYNKYIFQEPLIGKPQSQQQQYPGYPIISSGPGYQTNPYSSSGTRVFGSPTGANASEKLEVEGGGEEEEEEEEEEEMTGTFKRRRVVDFIFDQDRDGFPARFQTCLMLIPYCSADHIPPKKISIEEAEAYAEDEKQPPLDSPSYIEYIKDESGNLKRNEKTGKPMWILKCGAVYDIGILTQRSVCNNRSDNESIFDVSDRHGLFDCSGRKKVYVPTSVEVAQRNNLMEVYFDPTRNLMY